MSDMTDSIEFSEQDIKRGTILPADWYTFNVVSYESKLSKAGDSTNYVFGLVTTGTKDERFNGVPITHRFNSKAKGFIRPFLEACGAEIAVNKSFNLNQCVGKTVKAFVRVGEWENQPKNELAQFSPVD